MSRIAGCVAHLMAEMTSCRHRPSHPCRAKRHLPPTLLGEALKGVVSDRTLMTLRHPAELVRRCGWRRGCHCRIGGMFGAFILVASGELAQPPGCAAAPAALCGWAND